MFRPRLLFASAAALLGLLALGLTAGRAQDDKPDPNVEATKKLLKKAEEEYRLYIKRPQTILEYWAAMKYEMQLGKFDLAALHLKFLLEKHDKQPEEGDKDLLKIEAAEGLASLLNLRNVKSWSDYPPFQKEAVENVEKFIDRVTVAIEKNLGDPARIQKFIKRLDAPTPEERAFARVQLIKSGTRAVPYLVDALRVNVGKALHERIRDLMLEMDSEIVPAYLEVLKAKDAADAKDVDLRLTLLDISLKRGDRRVIPYLWHLSSAPMYPDPVREEARRVLSIFLKTDVQNLPSAKLALTGLAEDYYYHRVRFPAKEIRLWPWDGGQLAVKPVVLTPAQAEEFFGKRYAREALDLDPKYQPAQIVLLNFTLERTMEPDLDQVLLKPLPPNLKTLLVTIDPELLAAALERAMDDHNPAVILPAVLALGERGDMKAARFSASGTPRGLYRALYYPDRRVQFAAAQAALRMPEVPPVAAARVVEVLRRMLAADGTPRALAAYVPNDKAMETRQALKAAGYEAVLARNLQEAFDKLHGSTDYDLILLHQGLPEKDLPFVLSQLRSDSDQGGLPIIVLTSKDRLEGVQKFVKKYPNIEVLPELALGLPEEVKAHVAALVKQSQGTKLTAEERKEFQRYALDALWRMARGEYAGFDVRPAQDAVVDALRSPDAAVPALEILGRIPGADTQNRLAGVVADPAREKLRVPAAKELNRHIQKYGILLGKKNVDDLRAAYQTATDPTLKGELAVVMGQLRVPTPQQTGAQLFQFRPDVPAAPPEKKEKENDKEKEK
jgi:DNA-binding response OmpR family regulator